MSLNENISQTDSPSVNEKNSGVGFDRDCSFGIKCKHPNCRFTHPDGWDPARCRDGDKCTRRDCRFKHPEGWAPAKRGDDKKSASYKKPCRDGDGCTRQNCHFEHPEGWDPAKRGDDKKSASYKKFCKWGSNCTNDNCGFGGHDKKPKKCPEGAKCPGKGNGCHLDHTKSNIPCPHLKNKGCFFGDNCLFSHPREDDPGLGLTTDSGDPQRLVVEDVD